MSAMSIRSISGSLKMNCDEEARLCTANRFGIPLYYVELNHICHEKDVEWFYIYDEFLVDEKALDE